MTKQPPNEKTNPTPELPVMDEEAADREMAKLQEAYANGKPVGTKHEVVWRDGEHSHYIPDPFASAWLDSEAKTRKAIEQAVNALEMADELIPILASDGNSNVRKELKQIGEALTALRSIMGESDRSSDVTSKVGVAHPTKLVSREISVAGVTNLQAQQNFQALDGYLQALEPGTVVTDRFVHRLTNHYLPKLKESLTMECPVSPFKPVSVSLEKCAEALNGMIMSSNQHTKLDITKAVLDAAGVKYHD